VRAIVLIILSIVALVLLALALREEREDTYLPWISSQTLEQASLREWQQSLVETAEAEKRLNACSDHQCMFDEGGKLLAALDSWRDQNEALARDGSGSCKEATELTQAIQSYRIRLGVALVALRENQWQQAQISIEEIPQAQQRITDSFKESCLPELLDS
jgi:hypothetical protein